MRPRRLSATVPLPGPHLQSAMNENRYVRTRIDDAVASVIIDRQSKLNALNPQVVSEIDGAFTALKDDADVRAIILAGAGDKAFVAGADIGVLARMDPLSGVSVSRDGQDILRRIELFPKPVIAAVGGYALGGGCELALACHMRVASERARFGLPEVSLGIIPGYGGTVRLTRVVGLGRAVEMILSGDMIDAKRAAEIGLANLVVPHEELLERTRALAERIAGNAPVAVEMALKSIYQAVEIPMDQAQATEAAMFGLLASTDDMKEGMAAFLEKRKAQFSGR